MPKGNRILWAIKTETRESALQVIEIIVHQGQVKISPHQVGVVWLFPSL